MNLREALAEAKIALRLAEQEEATQRAIAEQRAIDAAQGKHGSNDTDRKRFLTLVLHNDNVYQAVLNVLNGYRDDIDRITATLATQDDERSAARLAERERHDAALERLARAWEVLGGLPVVQSQGRRIVDEAEDWA